MKQVIRLILKGEQGQLLAMALILMSFGSLIIAPSLVLMSTVSQADMQADNLAQGYYAADAGIKYAVQRLKSPGEAAASLPANVNNLAVTLTWQPAPANPASPPYGTYNITSVAKAGSVERGKLVAQVIYSNLSSFLLDAAITSQGDVTIRPGAVINGDVQYNGSLDNKGTINGDVSNDPILNWPTAASLIAYYGAQVSGVTPYGSNTINAGSLAANTPMYRNGSLVVETGTGTLEGTMYIKSDLVVKPNASLNLNGKTIFVEGTIDIQPGSYLSGPGAVISVGNLLFHPNMISGSDAFVFVMSVEGKSTFNPGTTFYGAVAGDTDVYMYPGTTLTWVGTGAGTDFPGTGNAVVTKYSNQK